LEIVSKLREGAVQDHEGVRLRNEDPDMSSGSIPRVSGASDPPRHGAGWYSVMLRVLIEQHRKALTLMGEIGMVGKGLLKEGANRGRHREERGWGHVSSDSSR
jgi:hypothetical protein